MNILWTIIGSILLGALAGWIAGKIMKNSGSFLRNAVLGIIGGLVGGILANLLHISGGLVVQLLIAVAGSCLVLWLAGFLRK